MRGVVVPAHLRAADSRVSGCVMVGWGRGAQDRLIQSTCRTHTPPTQQTQSIVRTTPYNTLSTHRVLYAQHSQHCTKYTHCDALEYTHWNAHSTPRALDKPHPLQFTQHTRKHAHRSPIQSAEQTVDAQCSPWWRPRSRRVLPGHTLLHSALSPMEDRRRPHYRRNPRERLALDGASLSSWNEEHPRPLPFCVSGLEAIQGLLRSSSSSWYSSTDVDPDSPGEHGWSRWWEQQIDERRAPIQRWKGAGAPHDGEIRLG